MTVGIMYSDNGKVAKKTVYGLDIDDLDGNIDEVYNFLLVYDHNWDTDLAEFFSTHTIISISTHWEESA